MLSSFSRWALSFEVEERSPDMLRELTARIRDAQRAIDSLLIRVGRAADRQVQAAIPNARDATALLLGDGRSVRAGSARREAARARIVAELPAVGAAVAGGRIGREQVDSFERAARDLSDDQRLELTSDELMDAASSLPADVFNRRLRETVDRIKGDNGLADTTVKQAASVWRHWFDERTGMGRISAEFDPERYEIIVNRVEQQLRRLANRGPDSKGTDAKNARSPGAVSKDSHMAATAAFDLICGEAGSGRGLPHLNVIVDWDTFRHGGHDRSLRETADGRPLPPESISRLACDAVVQRVVLDRHGVPVNVGRRSRTATDAQWQAIRSMYRTCAWDVCDRPVSWCQIHHVHTWEHGGTTDLCNLVPLCHRHHHQVHEGGWSIKLDDRRHLEIYTPAGVLDTVAPPDRQAGRRQRRAVDRRAEPEQAEGP